MASVSESVLKRELNAEQARAALKTDGAMLILAGAGSGKTRTVTFKIAYLVAEKQVDPRRILAVTFTNKAAREMRERIQKILGSKVNLEWMGTFHSICVRILRLCLSKAPIVSHLGWSLNSNFTIYDDDDQKRIVKDLVKADLGDELETSDLNKEIKRVRAAISHFKNTVYRERTPSGEAKLVLQTPEMVLQQAKYKDEERLAAYYQAYQKKLMEANAMDFDDLLLKTVDLLQRLPMIAEQFANRFEYVFVDEYQDTNDVQYELLKRLVNERNNVTVVGDDDQSIYGWRGANIDIIRNFHKDFSPVEIVKLERNYRSTSNIVKGAGSVIAHNERPKEMQKNVFSEEEAGDPIMVDYVVDDRTEAERIASRILKAGKAEYSETAIFYRTNAQSRVLEKALNDRRIPNVIFGGTRFWDRREIRDVLAYLRLVANPRDDSALFRILNVPPRQIGKATVELLQNFVASGDITAWEAIEAGTQKFGRAAQKVEAFKALINDLREEAASGEVPLPILAEHVIAKTRYKEFLEKDDEATAADKKGNLDELVNAIREFDEEYPGAKLEAFLQDVSLLSDADKDVENASERVTLMTIHMAKGLEFTNVHIGGCDQQLFPLLNDSSAPEAERRKHLEEERRLFYVGCTRAKKRLYLYHANARFLQGLLQNLPPSQFLNEIDPSVVDVHDDTLDLANVDVFRDSGPAYRGFGATRSSSRNYPQRPYTTAKPKPRNFGSFKGSSRFGSSAGKSERIVYKNPPKVQAEEAGPRVVYDEYSEAPIHAGAKVKHMKYGVGVVLKAYGQGENARAEIRFRDGVSRTLVLKFANLEVLG